MLANDVELGADLDPATRAILILPRCPDSRVDEGAVPLAEKA
jgi:hypothetical protein